MTQKQALLQELAGHAVDAVGPTAWRHAMIPVDAVTSFGRHLGPYSVGRTLLNERRSIGPVRRLVGKIIGKGLEHGSRESILRLPSGVAVATMSPAIWESYEAFRGLGEHLSKLKPEERVRQVRGLKRALGATKYMKHAPLTGDLYDALRAIPENRWRTNKPISNLLVRPMEGAAPESVYRKLGTAGWLVGRTAAAANPWHPTFFPSDVPYLLHKAFDTSIENTRLTSGALAQGMLGAPVRTGKTAFEQRLGNFLRTRKGQYLFGGSGYDIARAGKAFGEELRENPSGAVKFVKNLLGTVGRTSPEHRLVAGFSELLGPKSYIAAARALQENPGAAEGKQMLKAIGSAIKHRFFSPLAVD